MDQDEFVIFAELKREKFDEILHTLTEYFKKIDHGRQGDDWIWIHFTNDKIEIDSFYSMNLEVKGKYKQYIIAMQILQKMDNDWIIQIFEPPKVDTTR
jgi:hypothetical protein